MATDEITEATARRCLTLSGRSTASLVVAAVQALADAARDEPDQPGGDDCEDQHQRDVQAVGQQPLGEGVKC